MRKWGLFLSLAFLLSCATSYRIGYVESPVSYAVWTVSVPVYIDVSFSSKEKIDIARAITAWNHSLNGYVKLDTVSDEFNMSMRDVERAASTHALIIMQVTSTSPFIPKAKPGHYTLAWAGEPARHTIYVIRGRSSDDLYGIMLHEIGHSLGANHTDEVSLMFPVHDKETYQCIDDLTIGQIVRIYRIPKSNLNYCERQANVR